MRYEVAELGKKKSKELLTKVMKDDKGTMYCKYCGRELKYAYDKFTYNHGYHVRHIYKYSCECDDFEDITVGDTE